MKIRRLYCSFCGKPQDEVRKLIAGPTVFICNECTDVCQALMNEGSWMSAMDGETEYLSWGRS